MRAAWVIAAHSYYLSSARRRGCRLALVPPLRGARTQRRPHPTPKPKPKPKPNPKPNRKPKPKPNQVQRRAVPACAPRRTAHGSRRSEEVA